MRRRLVYITTGVVIFILATFAVAIAEVRVGFLTLAAAIVAGAWWLTRRLPATRVSNGELLGAAAILFLAGISAAMFLPSTPIHCECPKARGVAVALNCGCALSDHHTALRIAIAVTGVVLSMALVAVARRRPDKLVLDG